MSERPNTMTRHRIEMLVGVACPSCDYFNEEALDLDDTALGAHHLFDCDDCGERIDVSIEATIQVQPPQTPSEVNL